ncbi:hypothetical protein GEMRC1_011400 [Eukaryota sp. GEM-RC1]
MLQELIPGGALLHSKHSISLSGDLFAYASCLSIYIYDLNSFNLACLVTRHQRHITAIALSSLQHDRMSLLVLSFDNSVRFYNPRPQCDTITEFVTLMLPDRPIACTFHPSSSSQAFVLSRASKFYMVDADRATITALSAKDVPSSSLDLVLKHHPVSELLLCGKNKLRIYSSTNLPKLKLLQSFSPPCKSPIVDISFDPTSDSFCLISTSKSVYLYDLTTFTVLRCFSSKTPLSSALFSPSSPGSFLSFSATSGSVNHYLVSKESPTKSQALDPYLPIHTVSPPTSIHRSKGGVAPEIRSTFGHLIGGVFEDGSVFVYDTRKSRIVFKTNSSHSETVFACKFSPLHSNVLTTCSFDGTIRFFSLFSSEDLVSPFSRCKSIIPGYQDVSYYIDWRPASSDSCEDHQYLAVGYGLGNVRIFKIFEKLEKAPKLVLECCLRELIDFESDLSDTEVSFGIIRLHWVSPNMLLVSSKSGHVFLLILTDTLKLSLHVRMYHPEPVYGVTSIIIKNDAGQNVHYLITACQDKFVRLFSYDPKSGRIDRDGVRLLDGHQKGCFEVAHNGEFLVSGGDDGNIVVWGIKKNFKIVCTLGVIVQKYVLWFFIQYLKIIYVLGIGME